MENVADALKMAGSVVLFVFALSIAMLIFSQAKNAIDATLKFSDREGYTDSLVDGDIRDLFYYDGANAERERNVGLETIVPTLYRAMKESYIVEFVNSGNIYLFKAKDTNDGLIKEVYSLDDDESKKHTFGDAPVDKEKFITSILYGEMPNDLHFGDLKERHTYSYYNGQNLYQAIAGFLSNPNHHIIERIGTFYVSDRIAESEDDLNKKVKRIITYDFQNT